MLARSLPNLSMIKPRSDTLLLAVDFAGTFVFAMEGGMAAARASEKSGSQAKAATAAVAVVARNSRLVILCRMIYILVPAQLN